MMDDGFGEGRLCVREKVLKGLGRGGEGRILYTGVVKALQI